MNRQNATPSNCACQSKLARANLDRRDSTILFVGYQAGGTLGRTILDGAHRVRISGRDTAVRAAIRKIDSYSAHADRTELKDWILARRPISGSLFLTHGEAAAVAGLRSLLEPDIASIVAPEIGVAAEGRYRKANAAIDERVVALFATVETREPRLQAQPRGITVRDAQPQGSYDANAKQKAVAKLSRSPVKVQNTGPALKKPEWIRVKAGSANTRFYEIKDILRKNNLVTVCEEASCPNIGECFGHGTATFMIMGDKCTRRCPFCDVGHGRPDPLDVNEPENLAKTIAALKLKYVVITSVDRDDLRDGGAPVSYTHLRAHETVLDLGCRLLLEKKKKRQIKMTQDNYCR